jgi:hypothetical protein
MPPTTLDARVTVSTRRANARARSWPMPYEARHQTYAASRNPRPLMENGSAVVSVAISTIAGKAATGSEIRSESARSAFTATNKRAEAIPTTVPQRTA